MTLHAETLADITRAEETLDPEDWDELRALGHRMIDDMFAYLSSVRTRPAWQPVPAEIKEQLDEPLPLDQRDAAEVYEEFKRHVLPYPTGNIHPRFWGWVKGTGTPLGMLADMLASGMNANILGHDQSAALVETQVIKWLAELLGMPRESSGVLVSGGTTANLIALTVARNARAGFDVRARGLQHAEAQRLLVLYASTETHSCAQKAVELLGLGNESLRRIHVNKDYQIDIEALRGAVARDRADGCKPFCVIGNAGTVNTGAVDDLTALAAFCREEDLWFHVDGAFGALAALAPNLKAMVAGMEEADSIAFDLHKWMYLPYEAGCVLVRDAGAHRAAFTLTPSYLKPTARGIAAGGLTFAERGIQLSRGFRALKVWMSLKTHGARLFGRLIEQNARQARYLGELVESHARLELLAPVSLNVVCFRFRVAGLSEAELNALNEEILLRVQESGVAVPSSTQLGESFALRVAITNHRSRLSDFELLVKRVANIGEAVLRS